MEEKLRGERIVSFNLKFNMIYIKSKDTFHPNYKQVELELQY